MNEFTRNKQMGLSFTDYKKQDTPYLLLSCVNTIRAESFGNSNRLPIIGHPLTSGGYDREEREEREKHF
jgi:hypothetical protein